MSTHTSSVAALVAAATIGLLAAAHPAEQFTTKAGPLSITPIMHASMMIQAGGQIVYVDPAQGTYDGLPPADVILVTDIHGDHMAPMVIDKLKKAGTVVYAPDAVAQKLAPTSVTVISNGGKATRGPFTIEAIPMYNLAPDEKGTIYHEKGRGNGYVLTYGGLRVYIAGDTEGIPEMRALKDIDVAFVPMNLPYTMRPEAAADAVKAFHPKVVYPYHYMGQDPKVFAAALQNTGIEVRLRDWYAK